MLPSHQYDPPSPLRQPANLFLVTTCSFIAPSFLSWSKPGNGVGPIRCSRIRPLGSGFLGSLINDAMQRRYGDDCIAAESACFCMPTTVFPAVCRSYWLLTRLAAGLSLPRKRGDDDGDGWPPSSGGLSGGLGCRSAADGCGLGGCNAMQGKVTQCIGFFSLVCICICISGQGPMP